MQNYRRFLDNALDVYAKLRDRQLSVLALVVKIRKAIQETSLDEYGDPVVTYAPLSDISIIPSFLVPDGYLSISKQKLDSERDVPLEALVKTTEVVPVRSLIRMPSVSIELASNQFHWFEVISSFVRAQDRVYGQVIKMVPFRGTLPA